MSNLDRTPDGSIKKCCECGRAYRGEGWQDYCAECHAAKEESSPLNKTWACLTCNEKFPLGEVRVNGSDSAYAPMPCPRCGNRTISPADGAVRETEEYYGEIGTRN